MSRDAKALSLYLSLTIPLLLSSGAGSAPLTPGNVLVNDAFFLSDRVFEYSPAGDLVQEIVVPYGEARGVVVDSAGLMHVWNGPFQPLLSTYESTSGTWVHHSFPGWSSINCLPCNGIDALARYVFVTDMTTFGGEAKGIIRFDTADYSGQRSGGDQQYSDLSVGQDGLVYARRADLGDPPPPTVVDVYDPFTLVRLRSVTLGQRTLTITVDADGFIYGYRGGSVNQYDSSGNVIATYPITDQGALYDIDLSRGGRFVLSASNGEVILTDRYFNRIGAFRILSGSFAYVTTIDGNRAPIPKAAAVDLDPHVINMKSHAPWVTAYVEPSGFDPVSIDISTVRLAGSVQAAPKFVVVEDHNANGIPDLMLKFSRAALDPLLTPGMNSLEVTGSLVTGESFAGIGEVRVIDPGGGYKVASVAPNPFNPSGVLAFTTVKPGNVRVTMFDLQGRLVRTLMEAPLLPAGEHAVKIDGLGGRGEVLPSGVYFYQVNSADGTATGRFAILR